MSDLGQNVSLGIPRTTEEAKDGRPNIGRDNNSPVSAYSVDRDLSLSLCPTPIVVTNAKFDITYLNHSSELLFGFNLKHGIPKNHPRNLIQYIGSNTSAFINWIHSQPSLPDRGIEVILYVNDFSRYMVFARTHRIGHETVYAFNFLPSTRLSFLGMDNAVYQAVFEHSRLSIYITDQDHKIISANPGFTEMFGYSRNALVGRLDTQLYDDESNKCIARDAFAVVMERDYWKGRVTAKNVNGDKFAAKLSVVAAPIASSSPGESMFVHMLDDIEEQLEFESKLRTTAETDALTNLPNRLGFNNYFEQSLSEAVRTGCTLYVLFLDIDGFKPINDTHGHNFGDQLLISVAKRLTHALKEDDFVARLGGDEFVIIPGGEIDADGVIKVAKNILASIAEQYSIREVGVNCSTSIGIASYPDDALSADSILEAADSAMYSSKNSGGNMFTFYKHR